MSDASGNEAGDLLSALAAVAQAIAHSLDVERIWDRVSAACHTIVPFDAMGIVQLEPEGRVRPIAVGGELSDKTIAGVVLPRAGFSPTFWPDADRFLVVIGDAERELDLAYPLDRVMVERGYRSALRVPLGIGDRRLGSVLLVSHEKHRFSARHGHALTVVADLVTVALAH